MSLKELLVRPSIEKHCNMAIPISYTSRAQSEDSLPIPGFLLCVGAIGSAIRLLLGKRLVY